VLEVTEPVILLTRRNLMRKALREIAELPAQRPPARTQVEKTAKKEKAHVG
jgi:hypothetical protein